MTDRFQYLYFGQYRLSEVSHLGYFGSYRLDFLGHLAELEYLRSA